MKKKEKDYCFGLLLREENGVGFILEIDQDSQKVKVVGEKRFFFSSWDQVVEDVDKILSELEKEKNIRVQKAIFFLYSHLVDEKNKDIKKPYLQKIKNLVRELELKPLGYIECHDALSLYFKKKEETPLTAIIIELDKSATSFFTYKGGKLVFQDSLTKTENFLGDLQLAFAKIKGEIILPSRIILYNSHKLEAESTKIISHRWDESLFIQIPRVATVSFNELKEALIFSFANQLFGNEGRRVIEKKEEEVLGFVKGRDIRQISQEPIPPPKKAVVARAFFSSLKLATHLAKKITMKANWPLFLLGIVLITLSVVSLLYFFHKASLILYFQGKKVEKELAVVAVLPESSGSGQLALRKIDEMIDEEESTATTGKKSIGEKGRGEATLHNWEAKEVVFKKGTVLTAASGIKFTLDSEVKVASASEVSVGVKETGKTKGSLTAADIGPAGNIDKSQKLKIEDFSESLYFALPVNSFSGGTKQDIQTVSQDDIRKLKNLVSEKIKREADKAIKEKIATAKILETLTKVTITAEEYSKELGEEAKNISLKAKGKASFYTYDENDLKEIILSSLKEEIPYNYQLTSSDITYVIKEVKEERGGIKMAVNVLGKALAKIEKNNLLKDIAGKSKESIERIVKKSYQAQGYKLEIVSRLPFFKNRLPFFRKNISLRIESL